MSRSRPRRIGQARLRRLVIETLEERRVLAADWRNAVDALDVDDDHFVVPLDALLVINELNATGPRALPATKDAAMAFLDSSGDRFVSPLDALLVINHLNAGFSGQRRLIEGASEADQVDVTIGLGQSAGSRTYRVQLDATFDTSDSTAALEDVVAVYLVDPAQPDATLLDRGVPGSALFTLAGGQAEFTPGQVRWDGSVLEIDLTSLAARDTGLLRFQLLRSDADLGSRLTIKPLSNVVDAAGAASPVLAAGRVVAPVGAPLATSSLPIASNLEAQIENVRFDDATGRYAAELRVSNRGAAVGRDVVVEFANLPAAVSMRNPSGLTSGGAPYVNLRDAIPRGGLGAYERSDAVTIEFDTPTRIPFALHPLVRAGANHAPTLDALGTLTTTPGETRRFPLVGHDQDGDGVTYFVRATGALPTMTLEADGTLVVQARPEELGRYEFEVLARDGDLEASRSVTLDVVADPVTTTRFSGQVLRVDGMPLAGIPVQIGAVQGLTQADGSFLLDLGAGPLVGDTLKIRGELYPGAGDYPFIAEKLPLALGHEPFAHVNNVILRPIYLPELDLANGRAIDPLHDTVVDTAAIPGASVFVAAGTLMNLQGTPFTGILSMTEVPVELTPIALPEGMRPDLIVTIQPGEMVFAAPAPLTLPNRAGWAPGTSMDLWSINPVTGTFEDVGDMRVSADGSTVETISGGIRNSSWHGMFPDPQPPQLDNSPDNPDTGCKPCRKRRGLTSEVDEYSGAVLEEHSLVTYESNGATRGVTLVYDSLRADPRPIIHFDVFGSLRDPPLSPSNRLLAKLSVQNGNYTYRVPGYNGDLAFGKGGEHFWTYDSPVVVSAAIQADLRDFPTGEYPYTVSSGFMKLDIDGMFGRVLKSGSRLITVNTIDSEFGAGWSIAGWQQIVLNDDGVALLVDGDGDELRFEENTLTGVFDSPPGDFSRLERIAGRFFRTTLDKTVYEFDAANRLSTVTDRYGNRTTYQYAGGRLDRIVDSAGLETLFGYDGARVSTITDPAGRVTRFTHDAAGNLTSVTDPDGAVRRWEYDGDRHIVRETDANGNQEQTIYGFHGRAIGAVRKDGTTLTVAPAQTIGLYPPERTSDPHRPPPVIPPAGGVTKFADAAGAVTRTQLDKLGQATTETDGLGPLPQAIRNAQNLPTTIKDARGNPTFVSYDQFGDVLTVSDTLSGPNAIAGTINPTGDVDRYTFTGRAGQRILIDGPIADIGVGASITASDGSPVFARSGSETVFDRLAVLPADDTYRLDVGYVSNPFAVSQDDVGAYRVGFVDVDAAPMLPLGTVTTGQATPRAIYQFDGHLGQKLVVPAEPSSNVTYHVYDPWGRTPVTGGFQAALFGLDLPLSADGRYTLVVTSFDAATSFRLEASLVDLPPDAKMGLDVERSGIIFPISTDSYATTFRAPPGTLLLLHQIGPRHAIEITEPGTNAPVSGPAFVVTKDGDYLVRAYAAGYLGEPDDYTYRLEDVSNSPLLALGAVTQGTFSAPGATIGYRFAAQAGQEIEFGPGTELFFEIYGGTSELFASSGGVFRAPVTGEYSLLVSQRDYLTSPIDFAFKMTDVGDSDPLPLDSAISGQLVAGAEPRRFRYHAHDGERLFLEDLLGGSQAHVSLAAIGDNQAPTPLPLTTGRSFSLMERDYLVTIDAPESDRPTSYSFRFHTPKSSVAPLAFGQTTQAAFTEPLQQRIFEFAGEAGQRLVFDMVSTSGIRLDPLFSGPEGEVVSRYTLNVENLLGEALLIVLPSTGIYRFELDNSSYGDFGDVAFRFLDADMAMPAMLGTPIDGELTSSPLVDVRRLDLLAGQRMTLAPTLGTNDVRIHLFGPSGELVAQHSLNDAQTTVPIAVDGPYFLTVRNRNLPPAGPLPYQVQLLDANDSPVVPANLNQTYSDGGSGLVTLGQLTGNAGTRLWLDTLVGVDELSIFDPDDVPVSALHLTTSRGSIVTLPQSGTYSVKTFAFAPFTGRTRSFDSIPPIAIDQDVFRAQGSMGGVDLYRFDVVAGQSLQLDWTAGRDHVSSTLLSPGLREIEFASGEAPYTFASSGTYYLAVKSFPNDAPYGFRLYEADASPIVPFEAEIVGTAVSPEQLVSYRIDVRAGQRIYLNSSGGYWTFYDEHHRPVTTLNTEGVFRAPATETLVVQRIDGGPTPTAEYRFSLHVLDDTILPIEKPSATTYVYDPTFHEVTSVTDETGRNTRFVIDPSTGLTLAKIDVVGEPGGEDDRTTSFTYLPSGLLDTTTDSLGRVTDFEYDSLRRLTQVTSAQGTPLQTTRRYEYDLAGNVTASIDENNRRTTYEYDLANRLVRMIEPDPDGAGPLAAPITRFAYDGNGNVTSTTDPLGHVTLRTYDVLDRPLSETDPANLTTRTTYDRAGNVATVTDPLGHVQGYEYDERGRLVAETDAAGLKTVYEYDADDHLVSLLDPSKNRTRFEYDARGRVVRQIDPLGKATKFDYDRADNLIRQTDRLGRIIEWQYDDLNRPVRELWLDVDRTLVHTIDYAYDANGNLLSLTDDVGQITFDWDELDRLTATSENGPAGYPLSELVYTYDAVGNLLTATDQVNAQAGAVNSYLYDALDRPIRLTHSGVGVVNKRVDWQYDASGAVTSLTRFSDLAGLSIVAASTMTYDTDSRLASLTHRNASNATLASFTFQYDAASRITRITDVDGATDYAYDVRDELTGANHADAANPDETYAYDATGNRTSSHRHGSAYVTSDGNPFTPENNRLQSDGTFNYAYDDEGNLIRRTRITTGAVRQFEYDHRNRLVKATDRPSLAGAPTQVVQYTYDALDRRIAKNVDTTPSNAVDGVVTYFLYDGIEVFAEWTDTDGSGPAAATETRRYLHGPNVDQILAEEDAGNTVLWDLTDHLGTVRDLVNGAGQVVNHLKYDSYGNVISQSNSAFSTRYRFTGREFDAETGLTYYRARYYDPSIGRFLSEDPAGFVDGANLVAYVGNRPIGARDPLGNFSVPIPIPHNERIGPNRYEFRWIYWTGTYQYATPPASNDNMSPQAEANLNDMGRASRTFFAGLAYAGTSLIDFSVEAARSVYKACSTRESHLGKKIAAGLKGELQGPQSWVRIEYHSTTVIWRKYQRDARGHVHSSIIFRGKLASMKRRRH